MKLPYIWLLRPWQCTYTIQKDQTRRKSLCPPHKRIDRVVTNIDEVAGSILHFPGFMLWEPAENPVVLRSICLPGHQCLLCYLRSVAPTLEACVRRGCCNQPYNITQTSTMYVHSHHTQMVYVTNNPQSNHSQNKQIVRERERDREISTHLDCPGLCGWQQFAQSRKVSPLQRPSSL